MSKTITTEQLGKGAAKPALTDDGILRLYSMRYCPYAQRAHLVLNAKKVPYHVININLLEKPEWLIEVSALLKVPALQLVEEKDKPSLIESLVISEYVDEKYPQNPLLSKDPLKKAQDKILLERFSAITNAFMKILLQKTGLDDYWQGVDIFEEELKKRGTPFFGGEKPGYVDYMIWPWFERLAVVKYQFEDQYNFDEKRFENIGKWIALLKQDPVVQSYIASDEAHINFWKARFAAKK
ncbi:uncharacterized protein Dwil_GK20354 [Drosophila willistoni]|uniref:GK20354 n=1 Tax=Drosophila willistoni TaxID=7260 RepID=B4N5B2_DROWI|nr:pyrimidodiazepine synthase [Drosophila willistoni]EDW79551.1 uncharacterized protein Dwil_GK20354 [Drosophila willistoni]